MNEAVTNRREKQRDNPIKIDRSVPGKGKVLKFDRRAGVIVVEKIEPSPNAPPSPGWCAIC